MGRRTRFVKPKVVRLELSAGDWIDIKRELSAFEEKAMHGKALKQMGGTLGADDAKWDMDPVELRFGKIEEYLVGWSFEEEELDGEGNPTGKAVPVELTLDAIHNLDDETFTEIEEAIDKHREALSKEKKALGGKTE